jgi:hypothetical protein
VTGLAFHALYTHLFSVIVFLIKAAGKLRAKLEQYRVKRVPARPTLHASEPLQPDEMVEDPETPPCIPGVVPAGGQQV